MSQGLSMTTRAKIICCFCNEATPQFDARPLSAGRACSACYDSKVFPARQAACRAELEADLARALALGAKPERIAILQARLAALAARTGR